MFKNVTEFVMFLQVTEEKYLEGAEHQEAKSGSEEEKNISIN